MSLSLQNQFFMKKATLLVLPLLAALWLLLSACHKDEPAPSKIYGWRFSGKVLEHGSGKPIPNALVRVRLCESEFLGPVSCYTLKSDTSDAQGNYAADFDSEELFMHIDAIADKYYPMGQEKLLNRGEEKGYDLTLIAHSKMMLTFRNQRDTTVYFSYSVSTPDYPSYFQFIQLHPLQDTTRVFNMGGNVFRKITYTINPHLPTKQSKVDSVKCPAHDILIKEIVF
jgi:hypothetical protein